MQNKFLKIIFITYGLLLAAFIKAQINLVPNNSFEILDSCPKNLNELVCAKNWQATHATPDLLAYCYNGVSNYAKSPDNSVGYQCPSNGNNYGGFISYLNINNTCYQEILGIKLIDSLIIGQKYYMSFKLSLAGGFGNSYANAKNGIKLTTKPLPNILGGGTATDVIINNFANFYTNLTITDTSNWTTIKGNIVADSNYKYIYFGNFFQYSNTSPILLYGLTSTAYYYLDDVCLSTDSNSCKILNQVPCLATSVNEIMAEKSIYLAPNPCKEFFYIMGISETTPYKIYNSIGKDVKQGFLKEKEEILINDLPPSLYFIELRNKNILITKKIIINP